MGFLGLGGVCGRGGFLGWGVGGGGGVQNVGNEACAILKGQASAGRGAWMWVVQDAHAGCHYGSLGTRTSKGRQKPTK